MSPLASADGGAPRVAAGFGLMCFRRLLGVQARPVLAAEDVGCRRGTPVLIQRLQGCTGGLGPGDADLALHGPVLAQTEEV